MVDCRLQMMKKRHKIERDLSIGEEGEWPKNQQVDEQVVWDDRGLSSLANIMSFGSLAMHS
jgi:hypothetical protein